MMEADHSYQKGGEDSLKQEKQRIAAPCPLYACRICRTKTGWVHQSWCGIAGVTRPACEDCRYWNGADKLCTHPLMKKGGAAL